MSGYSPKDDYESLMFKRFRVLFEDMLMRSIQSFYLNLLKKGQILPPLEVPRHETRTLDKDTEPDSGFANRTQSSPERPSP